MKQMSKHRGKRDHKHNHKVGRMSMRLQWLNEFSDIGNELQSSETLNLLKIESQYLQFNNSSAQGGFSDFDASS